LVAPLERHVRFFERMAEKTVVAGTYPEKTNMLFGWSRRRSTPAFMCSMKVGVSRCWKGARSLETLLVEA
jgi:hypothetical protein